MASMNEVIGSLADAPYGFRFVDLEFDLQTFQGLDIQSEQFYHQFGAIAHLEERVAVFLSGLGENHPSSVRCMAAQISQIAHQVLQASNRETAWFHLRASVPTDAYDMGRWHMDGAYFTCEEPNCSMYKFAVTLLGKPTLFYALPQELRQIAWRNMRNRPFMHTFCQREKIDTERMGQGVFFLSGRNDKSALHSEPPIHENRLFFSIVPCSPSQLVELQSKVMAVYPK